MSDILKQITELSPQKQELLLRRLKQKKEENTRTKITPQNRDNNFLPLSFAQQRLWFIDQLAPGTPAYNIPVAIRLTGSLNVTALEQSLNEVIRRHEALRTNFKIINGQQTQAIAPALTLELPIVAVLEQEVQATIIQEIQQPFDLVKGPLLRSKLLQLAPNDYVFLLVIHHIISDGWSIGVMVGELTALYAAFSQNQLSPLPELPIQYADFALWQRNWLQGEVLQTQLDYWQQQLGGKIPVLELPSDRPRPPIQSFNGSKYSFSLPLKLTEALLAFSQQQGVTLFMTLLTAFQILLYRYSGQEDICVGSPIANRNRREIEGLIGFFVNTLALRSNLSGNPTFMELLQRVRSVTLGAYAHQDLPFEKLVEQLQIQRNPSHNPLFQVMFVLQNNQVPSLNFSGLNLNLLEVDSGTAQLDLTLSLEQKPDGLVGYFEYNTDLFNVGTISRWTEHFQNLLTSIVANPEQRVTELSFLTETEQQLLREWNNVQTNSNPQQCIHQLFEAQVNKTPDAIALTYEGQLLTYQQLNQRANQLAHHLQKMGVQPDTKVGICLERSLEMIIGILGILKAGGAYVPLDPQIPQERLTFILEDAQINILLTQQQLLKNLSEMAAVICLDADWELIAQNSTDNLINIATPDNLAYVIYTSGSTGKPKGVLINHANVVRLFDSTQNWYQFNADDVWTLFHSFAFDFSVWEIWGALIYGGRLVIVPYWVSRSPQAFYDLLCAEQVTVLNQTPSAFRQLIRVEDSLSVPGNLALRWVIFGGEALEIQSLKSWFERHGDQSPQLVNMYGITETTVHVTMRAIASSDLSQNLGSVIGRPIPDLQVYILDQKQQLLPIGIPGEMYVGGAGLARGYLNRPDLTAKAFINHPFSENPAARLYKTGDLARYLPNGELEYLGRIDHQVKIRGFRIELGEIEAALTKHPAIQETVVFVREDHPGDQRLVAYIVTKPNITPNPNSHELRSYLKSKLPDYMVPALFVALDYLPLTVNGKVDRIALPLPEISRPELQVAYVAPSTEIEKTITTVWQQILQVEKVGINDNFFDLGGHSLLMVQLQNKLQELLGQEISILDLFQYPTISLLANYLNEVKTQASPLVTSEIQAQKLEAGKNRIRQRLNKRQATAKNNSEHDDE